MHGIIPKTWWTASLRNVCRLSGIALLTAGCGHDDTGAQVDGARISITAGPGGTKIDAPGVDIHAGPEGAQTSLPETTITAGPEGVTVGAGGGNATNAASTDPLSDEMQILAKLVGRWNVEGSWKPAQLTPEGGQARGHSEYRWFLGHNFVASGPNRVGMTELLQFSLYTFDSQSECYRAWLFNSDGNSYLMRGRWNTDTNTLVFTIDDDSDPPTVEFSYTFVDENTVTGRAMIRDAEGNVIADAEWTRTR